MASRAFRWLPALLLPFAAAVTHAQTAGRLVEEVGVSEQRGYVAVTVLFGCSLRYVSHTPASSGDRVSVRLSPQPDCGAPVGGPIVPPALLGILGGGQLGRYFVMAARTMGYRTMVLEPDPAAPAGAASRWPMCKAATRCGCGFRWTLPSRC